ncbi:hypothetical protein ACX1C1_05270 [Paenibacillus sp. strain BS8-2]
MTTIQNNGLEDKEVCLDASDSTELYQRDLKLFIKLLGEGRIIKNVAVSNAGTMQLITLGYYDHDAASN